MIRPAFAARAYVAVAPCGAHAASRQGEFETYGHERNDQLGYYALLLSLCVVHSAVGITNVS